MPEDNRARPQIDIDIEARLEVAASGEPLEGSGFETETPEPDYSQKQEDETR